MNKKLANMLFFILLCFSVINALESNIKTTNASEFLDMKSCENYNLDCEILFSESSLKNLHYLLDSKQIQQKNIVGVEFYCL